MKLNKEKTELTANASLKLTGIPPAVFQYRLGNRSALDWVIDQYQAGEDKRSSIRSDPNPGAPGLVRKVVKVSPGAPGVTIVEALPGACGDRPRFRAAPGN